MRFELAKGLLIWRSMLFVVGLSPVFCWGQTRVLVSHDGEDRLVVAMKGTHPIVMVEGDRVTLDGGNVRLEEAERFTDGGLEVIQREALMGQDYGSAYGAFFFRFDATVQADRDFEDCFVLFVIEPEEGDPTYVMREIPDINVRGTERIVVTLPVNPGFGGGTFGYKLFSRGEEIERYEVEDSLTITEMEEPGEEPVGSPTISGGASRESERAIGATGRPAEVRKARLLDFPKSLLGKVTGGYGEALYSVNKDGTVLEVLDMRGDYPEFLPEVWKTVVESKYSPGVFNGKPLVTTVRQKFFFNEFAPFSEEMVMVPYPKIGDRDAKAIYSPLPRLKLSKPEKAIVSVTVSPLGKATAASVKSASSEAVGNAALAAVKDWIFLPAISDGFVAEQTLEIPIEFKP